MLSTVTVRAEAGLLQRSKREMIWWRNWLHESRVLLAELKVKIKEVGCCGCLAWSGSCLGNGWVMLEKVICRHVLSFVSGGLDKVGSWDTCRDPDADKNWPLQMPHPPSLSLNTKRKGKRPDLSSALKSHASFVLWAFLKVEVGEDSWQINDRNPSVMMNEIVTETVNI